LGARENARAGTRHLTRAF